MERIKAMSSTQVAKCGKKSESSMPIWPCFLNLRGLPMRRALSFLMKAKRTFLVMESGSPRKFKKHGQRGMELSDFLPHLATCVDDIAFIRSMHTEAFNHH